MVLKRKNEIKIDRKNRPSLRPAGRWQKRFKNITRQILNFILEIKQFPILCGDNFICFLYCLMQWKLTQN